MQTSGTPLAAALCWMIFFASLSAGEEPPVRGRPASFSGAVGAYRVTCRAEPTEFELGQPIRYSLRISGTGDLSRIVRPDLSRQPRFAKRFTITASGSRRSDEPRFVEFDYLLRPADDTIEEIPSFAWTYFKPGLVPPERGYQTATAPAIPIRVRSAKATQPTMSTGAVEASPLPPTFSQLEKEEFVLAAEEVSSSTSASWIWGGASLILWSLLGWNLYVLINKGVGGSRLRKKSLGKAARHALAALDEAHPLGILETHRAFLGYLQDRAIVHSADITPLETSERLRQRRVSEGTIAGCVEFLWRADACRFGGAIPVQELAGCPDVRGLIESIDRESC